MNRLTRTLPHLARVLFGLVFLVQGLNGLLRFLPIDEGSLPAPAASFMHTLAATGYLYQVLKITEVAAGALLVVNRFVPLALTLLAPVVVNIFAFHVLLFPKPAVAIVVAGFELYLAWSYRDAFRPMLAARVAPHGGDPASVPARRSVEPTTFS